MSSYTRLSQLLLTATLYAASGHAAVPLGDPMRPPGKEPVSSKGNGNGPTGSRTVESGYQLSAIRIAAEQRSATINGQRVSVGQRIGGARVEAIQAGSVTLSEAGNRFTISLLPISIKKPVEATLP